MKAYETFATVEPQRQIRLADLPFEPGTEVEIFVNAKRGSTIDFATEWNRLCGRLRASNPEISDEDIQKEVDAFRAGA